MTPALRRWFYVGGAWLAFYALALASGWAPRVVSDGFYLVPIGLALAASVLAALNTRGVGRTFWTLIAASNLLWFVGEIGWSIKEVWGGGVGSAFPAAEGVVFFAAYVVTIPAFISDFRERTGESTARAALEGSILAVPVALVGWDVLVLPQLHGGTSIFGLGYLLGGQALLMLVLMLLYAGGSPIALPRLLAACGLAIGIVTDAGYTLASGAVENRWFELGWQAEAIVLCVAALSVGKNARRVSLGNRDLRLPLGLVGATTGFALVVADWFTGERALDAIVVMGYTSAALLYRLHLTEKKLRRLHLTELRRGHELELVVSARTALLRQANAELVTSRAETVNRLSRALEFRDHETGFHVERMGRYCELIARKLGLGETHCELIRNASPLHDIGKIAIPDAVLLKPGRLTPEERAVVETHAEMGWEMLCDSNDTMLQLAAKIARTHHERVDGSGYPHGLAGDDIPLEGRIAAVADVFDALTSERVYRPALPLDEALALLRSGRGTHFDAEVLDVFLASLGEVFEIRTRFADTQEHVHAA